MPNGGEFRATTDQMLELIDELRNLESQKRRLPLGSPEFIAIARLTANHARLVFRWAQMQEQMAVESGDRVERGEMRPGIKLQRVTPRPLDVILANWREAQLRLEISRPGSTEAQAASDDMERLREEHAIAFEAHRSEADDLGGMPRPPEGVTG
jgi:hypothetical protein